jgi:hypothetical protein
MWLRALSEYVAFAATSPVKYFSPMRHGRPHAGKGTNPSPQRTARVANKRVFKNG